MKNMRRKLVIGAAMAVTALAATGIAATANADVDAAGNSGKVYTDPKSGGGFSFHHKTDNFLLSDTKADGRGLRAIYTINGQGSDYMYLNKGAHSEKIFKRNFREGTKLHIQVCSTKNGTPIGKTCSGWKAVRA
ncbi:MAG: hypothetical protein ACRD0P_15605 [Stackebrandtia sp.]